MTGPASTSTYVMRPRIGTRGSGETESTQFTNVDLSLNWLMFGQGLREPRYIRLCDAGTELPTGSFNVVLLTGGRRQFQQPLDAGARPQPWWHQIANRTLDAYTVWGSVGEDGPRILPDESRTSSGYGAIYTRWPVLQGSKVINIGFLYVVVSFAILDDKPELGDLLKVQTKLGRGYLFADEPADHCSALNPADFRCRLVLEALKGYRDTCTVERMCH